MVAWLLDWLCDRLGVNIRFDGDPCAPDGSEPWWPALEDRKLTTGRALLAVLIDDVSLGWPDAGVIGFLEKDGWTWDGKAWKVAGGVQ